MASKTDRQLEQLGELQNQIGSLMVELLDENSAQWGQARLHIEHRGPDHYRWSLLYKSQDDTIAGVKTKQRFSETTKKYMQITSDMAGEQVKRLRFHLDTSLKFNVEMWYTPTEGLPGWDWEEESTCS